MNNNVAANFSLRVFFVFSALQTQAKACGYQNRTFARASNGKLLTAGNRPQKVPNDVLALSSLRKNVAVL